MNSRLPPGPSNYLGFLQLTFRHYFRLRFDPIGFSKKLTKTFGDVVFFRIFHHRVILVSHPKYIHQILVSDSANFPKMSRIRNHLRQATGDGLLVTEGKRWHQQRTSTQKIFRSKRMSFFASIADQHISEMLERWQSHPTVEIETEMTLLTQRIMGDGFFGLQLESEPEVAEAVRILSDSFYDESRSILNLPDWLPTPKKQKKRRATTLLKDKLKNIIDHRIASKNRRDDYLDMLLYPASDPSSNCPHHVHASPDEIMSQLLTMYIAGFHTTSVAMAWLLSLVAQSPEIQHKILKQCKAELAGTSSLDAHNQENYAEMVVKESLRLYPAAWELFAREASQETKLGPYHIPRGSLLLILPIMIHHDERFYSNPEEFDPSRFCTKMESARPPHSWIPFGLGPHQCIGQSLALQQMTQILKSVVLQFQLKLPPDSIQKTKVVPKVSLRPAVDFKIAIVERNLATDEHQNAEVCANY
ncbi:cytochrome P450 [Mariniblastus sp.]|nr:cytochrome P450 [Mariniblastus sp.]MDB4564759.1 cytochrome P450 [Mariniblastus sp.]